MRRWEWGLGATGKDTTDPLDIFTLNSEAGGRAVDRGLLKAALEERKLDTGLASVVMWSDLWNKTLELHERKVAARALPGAALFAEGIPRSRASFAAFGTVKSSSMRDTTDPFAGIDDGDDANAEEERVWPVQDCAAYAVLVEVELEAVLRRRLAAGKRAAKRRAEGALAVDAIDARMRAGMFAILKPGGGGGGGGGSGSGSGGLLDAAPPEVLAGCAHLDSLDHRGMCFVCGRFNPQKGAVKAPPAAAAGAGALPSPPPQPQPPAARGTRHWLDLQIDEMQHRVPISGCFVTIFEVPNGARHGGTALPDDATARLMKSWRAHLIADRNPLVPVPDHAVPESSAGARAAAASTRSGMRMLAAAAPDAAASQAQQAPRRSKSAPRKSLMSIASTAARGRSTRSILPSRVASVRLARTSSDPRVAASGAIETVRAWRAAARGDGAFGVTASAAAAAPRRAARATPEAAAARDAPNRRTRVAAMGPVREGASAAAAAAATQLSPVSASSLMDAARGGGGEDHAGAPARAVVSAVPVQEWDGTDRRLTRHVSMDAEPSRVSIVMPISAMTPARVPAFLRHERSFHRPAWRGGGFDAEALGLPSVRQWPPRSPDAVSILEGWMRVRTLPLAARVEEPTESEQTRRFRALGFGGGEENSVDVVRRAVLTAASTSVQWTRMYGVLFSDAILEYSLSSSEAECDGFIDIRTAIAALQCRETYCPPHGIELCLPDRALMIVMEAPADAPYWLEVLDEQIEMERGSDEVLYSSQLRKRGKVNVAWQSRFVKLERSGLVRAEHLSARTRSRSGTHDCVNPLMCCCC